MIYPNGHIIYRVYENGIALPGVVKVNTTDISYKKVTTRGAGILGDFDTP